MYSPTLSQNFSVAKVLAILMVVASHWFTDIPLWPLAVIALFIFGFSSSFFTARKYGATVNVRVFWKTKVERLGIRYWLILASLSALLTVQNKDIFHWHTIVHLVGLSGILNLFGPSVSELGGGLWFFTLLLFFYIMYPFLAKMLLAGARTNVVLAIVVILLLVINQNVILGFSLWLTMLGFILGIYVGVNNIRVPITLPRVLLLASSLALVVANVFFGYRQLNGVLLFVLSVAIALWLTNAKFVQLNFLRVLGALEKCLLEIYLIHGYLFIRPTGISQVDFVISLWLVIAAALVLNAAGNKLVAWMFHTVPSRSLIAEDKETALISKV